MGENSIPGFYHYIQKKEDKEEKAVNNGKINSTHCPFKSKHYNVTNS
jgi:hypothetical protein